jgi:hypothetical protein
MAELSDLDIFLAYHAPKVLGLQIEKRPIHLLFDPKAMKTGLVAAVAFLVMFGLDVMLRTHLLASPLTICFAMIIALAIASFTTRHRTSPQYAASRGKQYLDTVYHSVYGLYGWNRSGPSGRAESPVPIRKAGKVMNPTAFRMADDAAKQFNRIADALPQAQVSDDLRAEIVGQAESTMVAIFEQASKLNPQGNAPVKSECSVAIKQLQEIADRLEGSQTPAEAPTGQLSSGLENTLLSLRADQAARIELNG